jgi:hypothetical protein
MSQCAVYSGNNVKPNINCLMTDVIKYCDVLALGFVETGKDKRKANGT